MKLKFKNSRLSGISFKIIAAGTMYAAGCSLVSAPSSESLPIPPKVLADDSHCSLISGSNEPRVYRCDDAMDGEAIFTTAVRDCTISEKFSHRATTRQLLIGFTNLKVLNQEPIDVGTQKVLRSVVAGVLDIEPVYVSTFTLRNGSCVTDLVMWKMSSDANTSIVGTLGAPDTVARRFAEATTQLARKLGPIDLFDSPHHKNSGGGTHDIPPNEQVAPQAVTTIPSEVSHATLPTG